jgi:predicted unusual protein kinase regulating ubiquinone biosynthesis (AarF/ABC1/UbiB family)
MEMVDGRRWEAAIESEQTLQDRWAEVIVRFVWGSLFRRGLFNADPHPGNYLFHEDGTVTFLDFGCVKRFTPDQVDRLVVIDDAALAGDAARLRAQLTELGFLPSTDRKLDELRLLEWYRLALEPLLAEQPYTVTRSYAATQVANSFDPAGPWADVTTRFNVPKDFVFLNRITVGLNSVLGGLNATRDWRALFDEVIKDGPLATDLGELERQWRTGP